MPTQTKTQSSPIVIEQNSVETAENRIEEAQNRNKNGEKRSVRGILTSLYKGIFGDKFKNGVMVEGMTMDGTDYIVSVGNKVLDKVISDPNMTAEKLAVLDNLQEVIQSAEYLGSGDYGKENANRKAHTVRYDYFENDIKIGDKDYTVSFDVQALRDKNNNFRTYKLDEIKISDTRSADVAPVATATENRLFNDVNISKENITSEENKVNSEKKKISIKKGDEVVHTKYKYGGTGKGKVVAIRKGKVIIKFDGSAGAKVFSLKNVYDGIIKKASEVET